MSEAANKRKLLEATNALVRTRDLENDQHVRVIEALGQVLSDMTGLPCEVKIEFDYSKVPGGEVALEEVETRMTDRQFVEMVAGLKETSTNAQAELVRIIRAAQVIVAERPYHWDQDPLYKVGDWHNEVVDDNTRLGYWDWVAHQKIAAEEEGE